MDNTEARLKEIQDQIKTLRAERGKLNEDSEKALEIKIRNQKYWESSQDFYMVGEDYTVHVADYEGGGGFTISQGIHYALTSDDDFVLANSIKPSTESVFSRELSRQLDRVEEIRERIRLAKGE